MRLTLLDGVGEKKKERLEAHGLTSLESVAYSNLAYFEQIDGVSPDLIRNAQEIMAEFPAVGYRIHQPTMNPDALGTYWCEHCGQHFQKEFLLSQDYEKPPRDKDYHNCDPEAPLRSTLSGRGGVQ